MDGLYAMIKPLMDPEFSSRYYYNRGDLAAEGQKIIVPEDSFFVLGTIPPLARTARYWGFVRVKYFRQRPY